MSGRLPGRRFREVQLLIGATLVVLVAVAVALLEGVLALAQGLEEEARRRAVLAAELLAGPRAGFAPPPASGVVGGVTFVDGRAVESWGEGGPEGAPWWPWPSRQAWERGGRAAAGPVRLGDAHVVVAYRPGGGGRVVRTVVAAPLAAVAQRWRWLGGSLALLVAGGGGVLAWLLISRALAPYRELLAEASRVVRGPGGVAEDRFLVEAFRTTIQRLETSERALRQRAEDLAVLSAGLAHELRNALATVTGYLRLLAGAKEEERREYLAVASQEAANLSQLLERFLTLTQPHTLRPVAVRLEEVVQDAVRRVCTVFPQVPFVVEGGGVELTADPMALSVAVENLLRNAAEASASNATPVEVKTQVQGATVRLVVEDRGPGVSADVAERLFVPFASTKPSGGLGLALARRMARLHGGDVRYEHRDGGGARFVLELPGREGA